MLYPDNALLHEIVRTAHDPDPVRATRFRPFGCPSVRRPLDQLPSASKRSGRQASAASVATRLAAMLWALSPLHRPAPCC